MRNAVRCAARRSGYTLTELLVVIGIIGLLLGLILPAINHERSGPSRRATCQSNLAQIGKACVGYHASRRVYPPGYLGPTTPNQADSPYDNSQYLGVHAFLLPFMGMDSISDQMQANGIKADANEFHGNWWVADATRRIGENKISVFLCPAAGREAPGTGSIVVLHSYLASSGTPNLAATVRTTGTNFGERLGTTNFLGVQGAWGKTGHAEWDKWVGVLYNRSKVPNIPDGSSNTLLFGEAVNERGKYTYAWMGAGALPVGPREELIAGTITDDKSWQLFSSEHPGVVNFCFADGSVQPVAMTIDQSLYEALAGIKDGVAVDLDRFLSQ